MLCTIPAFEGIAPKMDKKKIPIKSPKQVIVKTITFVHICDAINNGESRSLYKVGKEIFFQPLGPKIKFGDQTFLLLITSGRREAAQPLDKLLDIIYTLSLVVIFSYLESLICTNEIAKM